MNNEQFCNYQVLLCKRGGWASSKRCPEPVAEVALNPSLLKQEKFLRYLSSLGLLDEKFKPKLGYKAFNDGLRLYRNKK